MENLITTQRDILSMEELDKPSILYIDDEEDNLIVFKSAFRRFYKVHTAISGEEGLEIFRNENIALVITDQRMPHMTGVQFLQNLPEDKDVIRMILTGYSDVEAVIDAINTGKVYRYITKPWSKDELKVTLDNAIEAFRLRKTNKKLIQELKLANEYLEQKVLERTLEVSSQKIEIEKLLLNILPSETAQELKEKGYATPKYYENVSVLFTDFKDFTKIAEGLSPQELVAELNACFIAFDEIIEKNNLEKIKTIGDAFMCAGGIPLSNQSHPMDAIRAGLEIQEYMNTMNEKRKEKGVLPWNLRIGIHTGPVVAGVVGRRKFAYDIWGDAVNIASRMESSGEAGKVNISDSTFNLVKDKYFCQYRGKVSAKNKGDVDMYFVEGVMNERVLER
jgi:class 3 adenylate cyclase